MIKVSKVLGKFELSILIDEASLSNSKEIIKGMPILLKNEEVSYHVIGTDNLSNLCDVENDCLDMLNYIDNLLLNPDILLPYIDELPKKKNGSYYKGRVLYLKQMDNCCDFYTDFTNAWDLPVLRLKVISDSECMVEFNTVQITN